MLPSEKVSVLYARTEEIHTMLSTLEEMLGDAGMGEFPCVQREDNVSQSDAAIVLEHIGSVLKYMHILQNMTCELRSQVRRLGKRINAFYVLDEGRSENVAKEDENDSVE